MRFVWFGDGTTFPCDRFYKLLRHLGQVITIQPRNDESCEPLDQSSSSKSSNPMFIVTHPLWVRTIVQKHPDHVVVFMTDAWPHDAISMECTRLLLAAADLIVTTSERTYLEQCLRRQGVFLWQSDDPTAHGVLVTGNETWFLKDCEVVLHDALQALAQNDAPKLAALANIQWQQRTNYYEQLLQTLGGPHETASFLLAIYKYLLHDAGAADDLIAAFKQMVANGRSDCLRGQYRFLAAIRAQQGHLADAIQTYGISAITLDDRRNYLRLLDLYNAGEERAARAELFRLNDDLRAAVASLAIPTTHPEIPIYARTLLELDQFSAILRLRLLDEVACPDDMTSHQVQLGLTPAELHGLHSLMAWQNGESFNAIHELLLAAVDDGAWIHRMHSWMKREDAMDTFVGRYQDDAATNP